MKTVMATNQRIAVTAILVVATMLAAPLPRAAIAGEAGANAAARAHFRRAEADYAAGKYAVALEGYQAGYDAAPLPGFLVNMAQCHRRLGDLARARATYARFIMVAPDSPLVPEVTKLIAELDRLLAESQAAENARSSTPGPDDVVAPGDPAAPAAATSPPATGVAASDRAAPPSLAAPEPAVAAPRHVDEPAQDSSAAGASPRRWWLWGGVALAVAGAATAVILLSSRDPETIHEGSLGTLRR